MIIGLDDGAVSKSAASSRWGSYGQLEDALSKFAALPVSVLEGDAVEAIGLLLQVPDPVGNLLGWHLRAVVENAALRERVVVPQPQTSPSLIP